MAPLPAEETIVANYYHLFPEGITPPGLAKGLRCLLRGPAYGLKPWLFRIPYKLVKDKATPQRYYYHVHLHAVQRLHLWPVLRQRIQDFGGIMEELYWRGGLQELMRGVGLVGREPWLLSMTY